MTEIVIRPAMLSDVEAIADLHHRCSLEAFVDIVNPGAYDGVDPRRRIPVFTAWIAEEPTMSVQVADLDGRAIGHVVTKHNEIVHLFVDPDHWGVGLGRRLLEFGESILEADGHRTFELHTMVGNRPAIALYESAGWVMTDQLIHNDQDGIEYDEHVLIKHV